ncbi:MAG: lipopolysaccharide assembly protein LapA domain-containing protein [Rickettsiales bacterium]|jgi:uncharacterized integral membrane protein|nr:lipopolysaccharide assembly protein LapA domain-containing protein [Rickettsiales bacterium]
MFHKIKDVLKVVLSTALFVIFMIFISSNTTLVELNLFPFLYTIKIRLFLLIIFTFILGMCFSMFLGLVKKIFNFSRVKKDGKA